MPADKAVAPVEAERLSRVFRVLGVANRIDLLRILQVPHAIADIELRPVLDRPGLQPGRPLSRQAIQEHLARLQEIGLVRTRTAMRDGRRVKEYVVNHPRLFLVNDELRELSRIRPARTWQEAATQPGRVRDGDEPTPVPEGPALVVVRGPAEGHAFALAGSGPWVVGRGAAADVDLEHDPFTSQRNALVSREEGEGFRVRDVAGSTNGTQVNWTRLGEGRSQALVPGDTLGVGRSLLVFRAG